MPCANCGKTFDEHLSGLAYRDFTDAGTECNEYAEMDSPCRRCGLARFACECGEEEREGELPPECRFCGALDTLKEYDDSSPADGYMGTTHVCKQCREKHYLD